MKSKALSRNSLHRSHSPPEVRRLRDFGGLVSIGRRYAAGSAVGALRFPGPRYCVVTGLRAAVELHFALVRSVPVQGVVRRL